MSALSDKVLELGKEYDGGAWRYYVNYPGATLNGTLDYHSDGAEPEKIEGFVGLVDDHAGGMIAYGPVEVMDDLAERLNKLHIIEELLHV